MSISSNSAYKHNNKLNVSKLSKSFFIAVQLGSFTCLSAYAQEVTISDERNTGISTGSANGSSAADIIIDTDGSITYSLPNLKSDDVFAVINQVRQRIAGNEGVTASQVDIIEFAGSFLKYKERKVSSSALLESFHFF